MMIHPSSPRRRRMGALVAVLAGSAGALRGTAAHVENAHAAPLWPHILEAASIVLLIVAVVLLAVTAFRRNR